MSEEKRRVLEMLEAGQITGEDAARLLEALGEGGIEPVPESCEPHIGSVVEESYEKAMEEVRTDLKAQVDEAARSLGEVADQVVEAMGGEGSVPSLTLWPDMPEANLEASMPAEAGGEEQPAAGIQTIAPIDVHGEPYSRHDGIEGVENIDIEWVNGPVELRLWNGQGVNVTEYSSRPLDWDQQLQLQMKDGSLQIRWTNGKAFWKKMLLSKHLVVEIPGGLGLERVKVKNVSGKISAAGFSGEKIELSSVSGGVEVRELEAERLECNSVSGSVRAEALTCEKLDLNSTSGSVSATGIAAEKVDSNTVSGTLTVHGNAESFDLNSVSGSVQLAVEQCPQKAELGSVSGKLTLVLPHSPGFTVEYNSKSGSFHSDYALTGNVGKKAGKGIYGTGESKISFNSVSGGIRLIQNQ